MSVTSHHSWSNPVSKEKTHYVLHNLLQQCWLSRPTAGFMDAIRREGQDSVSHCWWWISKWKPGRWLSQKSILITVGYPNVWNRSRLGLEHWRCAQEPGILGCPHQMGLSQRFRHSCATKYKPMAYMSWKSWKIHEKGLFFESFIACRLMEKRSNRSTLPSWWLQKILLEGGWWVWWIFYWELWLHRSTFLLSHWRYKTIHVACIRGQGNDCPVHSAYEGIVRWRDMSIEHDVYTSSFQQETDKGS